MSYRALNWLILICIACIVAITWAGCKPPEAPKPPEKPAKALVCLIGGKGGYQLYHVAEAIRLKFPDANVVEFKGHNSYLSDLGGYIKANPHGKVIVIGHSWGNDKIHQHAKDMGEVALWIMFDPVPEVFAGTFTVPGNVKRSAIIWGNPSGLWRATVKYPSVEYLVRGNHSEICHMPHSYDIVEREIAWATK